METIAVTGATGFIGKRVVQKLLEKGYRVKCIARKEIPRQKIKNLEFFNADINSEKIADAFKGADFVVHLAAALSSRDTGKAVLVNVEGTKNVLQAAKNCKAKKFVFMSSELANFPDENFYGRTKLAGELLVKESGIPFVVFRPTIVFGPWDNKNLSFLIKKIKSLPFAFMIGKGDYFFQPVFVDNLANAVAASLEKKGALGKTFGIGGERIAFKKIVETILEEFQWKKPIIMIPKKFLLLLAFSNSAKKRVQMLSMDRPVDILPAKKILGFDPITFREALVKTMKEENWI